ncbi:MAG: hypothetical protein HC780_04180 [Leptolyngbyaceae cyanobacterium CSU_1_3]|nr:hypothetical protein [Leptolyngbyaceae cyanobacterium CSU_1_3]
MNDQRSSECLVVIMNNERDMEIAREQHWYRIPVESVEKYLKKRCNPEWLAFYQTKVFGDEGYAIRYYAKVKKVEIVDRVHLFPEDSISKKRYYKIEISALERLSQPIISQHFRRIVFIQTTLEKLKNATEVKELYSPP